MKTIKKLQDDGYYEIKRVNDKEAKRLVSKEFWEYCPKHEYKDALKAQKEA